MPHSRVVRVFLVAAALVSLVLLAGIGAIPTLRWRAKIVFYKSTGQINDIDWSDLTRMLRPGSDIYLEHLAETRNPYLTIENPRGSKCDVDEGKQLFAENCSPCHGDQGHGGPGGPDLYDRIYRQGHSDWALYRTITVGIPKT